MARGDQVYAIREVIGIPYEHHGIDCGDGSVIHYSKIGEASITRTPHSVFARDSIVYVKQQSTSFIADVVVERAESRLGERQYDLFFNNCEHFANWCKIGRAECSQLSNFGLRLDQIGLPQVGDLAGRAAQSESPAKTLLLFQEALGNVAIATRTLLPNYNQATQDVLTWHRVAQRALEKGREDLARKALHKKVAAKKEAVAIKEKLTQLSDLQLTLEQNQTLVQSRML
ncbi:MAG: lecithin retinol acyltransferase family protein [Cyanobacteria bacterium P01_F01_bin.53]